MKIKEPATRYKPARKSRAPAAEATVPTRISVRLTTELAQQLDRARRARKLSATAVIEQALSEYLGKTAAPGKLSLLDALKKHGVLGAVDLGPNASRDYKKLVADSVAEKHGHR